MLEGQYKEEPKIAVEGTEHTVGAADNETLHRKLISKPVDFQRSPKKDRSPNKHKLRGPVEKNVSVSEKAQLMEEGIISESNSKVRKVESSEKQNDFECYDKSDGKTVHVNIDKELAVHKPTLVLLPNRSEEEGN